MNNKIENLRDLFIEQGRELFDTFRLEQKEIPKIQRVANNKQLKKVLNRQLETAKNQASKMEQAFKNIEVNPRGEKSEVNRAVFKHTKNLMERSRDPKIRDASIINSMQRLNHNKIAGLGSLSSYAKEIGQQEVANAFHETLEEERSIDQELSNLALNGVNKRAMEQLVI